MIFYYFFLFHPLSAASMTYDCPPRSEDVSAFKKGLHLSDTQWSAQSCLQQRQTPETVLLAGECSCSAVCSIIQTGWISTTLKLGVMQDEELESGSSFFFFFFANSHQTRLWSVALGSRCMYFYVRTQLEEGWQIKGQTWINRWKNITNTDAPRQGHFMV